jgi:hypothetical protein
MKTFPVLLSITLSAIVVSSDFVPAAASRMNGKCCMSSDGGRSARYRYYTALHALPRTCSAYAASCLRVSRYHDDAGPACFAAKLSCLQTGVHIGPYSGYQYAGLERR